MQRLLIGLIVVLAATPAGAQAPAQSDYDICYSPTATDDQTIDSCTTLIQSGNYSGVELSHLYNNRADGYEGKQQWDAAIRDDDMAIQYDPSNAQAFNNRCLAYGSKSLYDSAISDCTQAIALKPGYEHAYANRAQSYERNGQRDLAIADYRTAYGLNPNDHNVTDGMGRLGVTP